MIKIYICPQCGGMRMVSRRKTVGCNRCGRGEMRITNLNLEKYTDMSSDDRNSYARAWLYIHNKQKG
jgi:hypothetical protein